MKLDSDAIKRLNKTDITDISSWKREYIEIAEGFRHERMFKDDDQGKNIINKLRKIFKAVGLAIPNGGIIKKLNLQMKKQKKQQFHY